MLVELFEHNKEEYNHFVATAQSGSFLQSWEWGEWQQSLNRPVKRFQLKAESGEVIGMVQFIRMPLPLGKYYWYCPYGPVFVGGGNLQFPIGQLAGNFLSSVFIRIEPKDKPVISNQQQAFSKTKNIQPGKTLVVNLAKTQEELLAEMHPKTRYNIKLAQKHGVEVQDEFVLTVGRGLYTKEAVELIAETSRRQGFKAQDRQYFEKLVNFFALNNHQSGFKLHIYKALYEKQLLASAIIIDFGATRTYLFGGSSNEHKNVMAPYLLHFKAMLDAKAQGLEFYDFWGVETAAGDTPGFVRFKFGFSTSPEAIKEYAGAYDLILQPFAYKIYSLLRKINTVLK